MPPGFPPAHSPLSSREPVVGPSEELALGEAGLIAKPEVEAALTFLLPAFDADAAAWRGAWKGWVAGWFVPVLAPALLDMANLAVQERVHELRSADLALAARLTPEAVSRLGAAGRRLLADLRGARSARWLERFQTRAANGETPALFPTVFAARAALFHLPPRPMLADYARLEWRAASASNAEPPTDAVAALGDRPWRVPLVTVAA